MIETMKLEAPVEFRDLFKNSYDDKFVEKVICKAQDSQKIDELSEEIEAKYAHINDTLGEFNSKGQKLLFSGLGLLAISGIVSAMSSLTLLLPGGLISLILGVWVFREEKKYNKSKASALTDLSRLHKQLAEATLGGKIIGDIAKIEPNWQNIYLLKDGETQEYMIRLQEDNYGDDFIETKKISNND